MRSCRVLVVGFTAFIIEDNCTTDYGQTRPNRSNLGLNPEACRSVWVSALIGEISSSVDEQSSGIVQINTAMANLDQMTQQNAALVEESGAAASSLREQAFVLKDSVNRFKLA